MKILLKLTELSMSDLEGRKCGIVLETCNMAREVVFSHERLQFMMRIMSLYRIVIAYTK